jgi:hypothetical protein
MASKKEYSLIAVVPSPTGYPGGHAINVNGVTKNEGGEYILNYFDPYIGNDKTYTCETIALLYIIEYK